MLVAVEQHRARDCFSAEAVAQLVERRVEHRGPVVQRELGGACVLEVRQRDAHQGEPSLLDERLGGCEQGARGREDGLGPVRGLAERVRARGALEICEAEAQRHGARHPARPSRSRPVTRSTSATSARPPPRGCASGVPARAGADRRRRLRRSTRRGSRPSASACRWRPAAAAQQLRERALADLRDCRDGPEPGVVEPLGGDGADAPEPLHRQRMEELELAARRDHQQPVRLGHRARHLRQELGGRHADADREADLVAHLAPQPHARSPRGVPAKCSMPRTSRKASSIDSASTVGAVSSKISKTALLASV